MAQDAPPTAPPSGPGIDIGGLVSGIVEGVVQGFQEVLSGWANQLPDQTATNGNRMLHSAADRFAASGLNFVFHTPMDLLMVGANTITPADVRTFTSDMASLAILLAGISYVGQYMFGWPGLGETISRVVLAVILTGSATRLIDVSANALNSAVGALSPGSFSMPSMGTNFPLVDFLSSLVWTLLLLRLEIQMGKRIIWLATLAAALLPATPGFMHSKSAWIPSMLWKAWWGWLLGQLIVVISVSVSLAMASRVGGPGGYILSLAALLVAYDAVYMLVPKDGGLSVSVGAGPARLQI